MLISLSVRAQFTIPGTVAGANANRPALSADVKTTVVSNTPHGGFTQSQSGKYWRSQDGKTRQDTSFGSVITDPKARTITHLNHTTKEATIILMPSVAKPELPPPSRSVPATGQPVLGQAVEDLGEKEIAGYLARGRKTVTKGDQKLQFGFVTTEVWTATTIQLPLYIKQSSSRGESVQQYDNIRIGEPEASLFAIPQDYTITEKTGTTGGHSRTVSLP